MPGYPCCCRKLLTCEEVDAWIATLGSSASVTLNGTDYPGYGPDPGCDDDSGAYVVTGVGGAWDYDDESLVHGIIQLDISCVGDEVTVLIGSGSYGSIKRFPVPVSVSDLMSGTTDEVAGLPTCSTIGSSWAL